MTVGRGCLPNLVGDGTIEKVEVQTEYLDYFTRNIQSFGSSLICVVCDIDKIGDRSLKLYSQCNTTYLWVVDFCISYGDGLHM